MGLQHHLWLSADAHQYSVRLGPDADGPGGGDEDAEGLTESVHRQGVGYFRFQPAVRMDGLSESLPGARGFPFQFLPPELKAWAALAATQRASDTTSARVVAEREIVMLKGFFKNYTVRQDSWGGSSNAGVKSVRYVADYEDKSKAMVEYRTCLLGQATVYWFVFRTETVLFETDKPAFDSIVAGLFSLSRAAAEMQSLIDQNAPVVGASIWPGRRSPANRRSSFSR